MARFNRQTFVEVLKVNRDKCHIDKLADGDKDDEDGHNEDDIAQSMNSN